jgi:glutathionylspermidine synthase
VFRFGDIEKSWHNQDFHLYGRFDISYDGKGFPKLLEYNADTPTSIIESSGVQEEWCKDHNFINGQFNNLHENFVKRWKEWKNINPGKTLHLACDSRSQEEWCNLECLKGYAIEAGIEASFLNLEEIIWNAEVNKFKDSLGNNIDTLFKLYPWESLVKDPFYPYISQAKLNVLEPMWKMLLSTKAILPLLWEKYPNHPNLLASYFCEEDMKKHNINYVKKPLYSREGENIEIYDGSEMVETQIGRYGIEGFVYQERKDVVCFDNRYSMIGLWVIGNKTSGIGIREDVSLITKDTSWFIPHYIKD